MKRNLIGILSLVVMSLMLNATGAYAQSGVKADVLFAFRLGSAQLPAGTYEINATGNNAIAIRNSGTSAGALSNVRRESPRNTRPKLVFHQLGSQYFLAEIWRGADSTGMVIAPSKMEKELKKELQLASAQSSPGEEVLIVLY
jgi:hypothetical protein